MKVSFDRFSDDYIGNYSAEYNQIRNTSNVNASELLANRKNRIQVGEKMTKFQNFIKENANISNAFTVMYQFLFVEIENKILPRKIFYLSQTTYQDIGDILRSHSPNLIEYIEDFALMRVFADEMCKCNPKNTSDKRFLIRNIIPETIKEEIETFFAKIGNHDINKITITYRPDNEAKNKNMQVNIPTLMRMILYTFAREYYTYTNFLSMDSVSNETHEFDGEILEITKYDNRWESFIIERRKTEIKKGRNPDPRSSELRSLVTTAYRFMKHLGIFAKKTNTDENKDERLYLIGKLYGKQLGYPDFNPIIAQDCADEKEYYSKRLKNRLEI